MAQALIRGQINVNMLETGTWASVQDMALAPIPTAVNMKDVSKTILRRVVASSHSRIRAPTSATGRMTSKTARESSHGPTVINSTESGIRVKAKLELSFSPMGQLGK